VLLLYGVSAAAALGCILIARGHNLVTGMVLLLFMGACWIGVRRLGYPEFAEFGPIFSRGRVEARIRLLESAEGLRQAATPQQLWERFRASAALLDLEELRLETESERRVAAAPPGRPPLWRLQVPLERGGTLTLGRSRASGEAHLSLEVVGEELRAVMEEALSRWEGQDAGEAAAVAAPSPAPWAPSTK